MQTNLIQKLFISMAVVALATGCASSSHTARSGSPVLLAKADTGPSGARQMSDGELDGMAAGLTGSFEMINSGDMTLTDNSVQSISLTDQAQQNLSSMVNILSINSTIQVLLNLNVNINSTVGTVNQANTGAQTGLP